MRHLSFVVILLGMMAGYQNCAKVSFSAKQDAGNVNGQNIPPGSVPGASPCRDILQTYDKNLRVIFMVDDSGSTFASATGNNPGTDPNFVYRKDSILNFLSVYGSKPNFTYAFGKFGDNRSYAYDINTQLLTQNYGEVFGDANNMQNALTVYVNSSDHGGGTPYGKAFDILEDIIIHDSPPAGYQTDYAVVFMSDGAPTDVSSPTNTTKTNTEVINMVHALTGAAAANNRLVTVNTIYFGPQSGYVDPSTGVTAAAAIEHLQVMANAGFGQFINTNTVSGTLQIDSVITVPGVACTPNQ